MIKEAIGQLMNKEELSKETVEQVMDEIMTGQASQMLMASYLTALAAKGETVNEITASAIGMRKAGTPLKHSGSVFAVVQASAPRKVRTHRPSPPERRRPTRGARPAAATAVNNTNA